MPKGTELSKEIPIYSLLYCIPHQRYTWVSWAIGLRLLEIPRNVQVRWKTLNLPRIDLSRNKFAEVALDSKIDYVLFHDSDIITPRDALIKLLSHGVDVCSAVCPTSKLPPEPAVYHVSDWKKGANPIHNLPAKGLIKVDAVGTGFILIKTSVFRRIGRPFFQYTDKMGEDFFFAYRLKKASIPIYVDCSVRCLHVLPVELDAEGSVIGVNIKREFEKAMGGT